MKKKDRSIRTLLRERQRREWMEDGAKRIEHELADVTVEQFEEQLRQLVRGDA